MLRNGHHLCTLFIIVVTFILIYNPCFATIIIAIQTFEDVVIAADSKSTIKNYQGEIISISEVSKITQKNDVLFASSSFVEDTKSGFDANKVIYEALENPHPLIQAATIIQTVLSEALNTEWVTILEQAPQHTQNIIESGKLTTKVLLASYENNRSIVIMLSFHGVFDESGRLIIKTTMESCPGTCPPNNSITTLLGSSKVIIEYLDRHGAPSGMSREELVKFLIQLEIDAETPSVGPPIDVVKICKEGVMWLSKKNKIKKVISGD